MLAMRSASSTIRRDIFLCRGLAPFPPSDSAAPRIPVSGPLRSWTMQETILPTALNRSDISILSVRRAFSMATDAWSASPSMISCSRPEKSGSARR